MTRPAAVLFDCDGVLVDSEPMSFDLLIEDIASYGLTMPRPQFEALFIGGTIAGVATKARQMGANLPETWVEDFYAKLYAHLAKGTPIIAGIVTLFDRLDAAGIPYAVGSNGSDHKMQVTLGQHPALYTRLQGRLFSGQSLGKPKPAPDLWLHAAAALGADPAQCVVVEDSPTGARGAKAAGMRCYGYMPHGDNPALTAEGAIPFRAMADLPNHLGI